jgi:3-phenylpropionate/trans-cinnamate dioxygenase ferredoxin reductase component
VSSGRVVIVGAGPAAHGAVTSLRQAGFRDEVLVIGAEPYEPYERPHLSKRFLLEDLPRDQLFLPPLEAELRLGEPVAELDPDRHLVRLAGGDRLEYGRLLLATGARARTLPGQGRLLTLRALDDAVRVRALLDAGHPLEIVGAGFIGCEVAAVARTRGLPVVVLEALPHPLLRVLGPELAEWLAGVHRRHGVDLRTGVTELGPPGDLTLVAVGTQPNVELAAAAGVRCEGGVIVDAYGRTEAPDVYAAGDCARFWSPLFEAGVRVEHFQTALHHGAAVGRVMAGDERPFAEAPWFWSDQYDLNLQYVGGGLHWSQTVVRGRHGEPPFTACYLQDGRLVGAAGVNDGRTISQLRRLMETRVEVSPDQLADRSVDLKRLVRARG